MKERILEPWYTDTMRIEIDQSVKIEQLSRDTVIGLANDIQFATILSSKTKRKLQNLFSQIATTEAIPLKDVYDGGCPNTALCQNQAYAIHYYRP